jgi:dTDP-4-dehydrorhamnose reductase
MQKNIVVLGANGQLGQCLQKAASQFPDFNVAFLGRKECDITKKDHLEKAIKKHQPEFIINASAYTQVDVAEDEKDKAFLVNAEAVEEIAKLCHENGIKLVHISTDYVFNGQKSKPYVETDKTNPVNVYGASKLAGEKAIQDQMSAFYIIRTSWLYSEFSANFYTAMRKRIGSGIDLKITTDQTGCPTNANDLAEAIFEIISSKSEAFGVYHFCNSGEATWYDFAHAIFKNENALDSLQLSSTDFYPTKAKRPAYSVMNTNKIASTFGITIKDWKTALLSLQD